MGHSTWVVVRWVTDLGGHGDERVERTTRVAPQTPGSVSETEEPAEHVAAVWHVPARPLTVPVQDVPSGFGAHPVPSFSTPYVQMLVAVEVADNVDVATTVIVDAVPATVIVLV